MTIPVSLKKGDTLSWNWSIEAGNIDVTNTFGQVEVYKGDRVSSHEGSYTAEEDGVFSFHFDNSFSWVNGKNVIGIASIKH